MFAKRRDGSFVLERRKSMGFKRNLLFANLHPATLYKFVIKGIVKAPVRHEEVIGTVVVRVRYCVSCFKMLFCHEAKNSQKHETVRHVYKRRLLKLNASTTKQSTIYHTLWIK